MHVYSLFCGIFAGAYNAVLLIAVLDCAGQEKLAKAFGFQCFAEGLGLCIGSPLAGNYRLAPSLSHSVVGRMDRKKRGLEEKREMDKYQLRTREIAFAQLRVKRLFSVVFFAQIPRQDRRAVGRDSPYLL